jgi:hypothetical protein
MVTTNDLRTLIARKSGLKKRVALLATDDALVSLLKNNGHEVLANPENQDAITHFDPQLIIGFDGLLSDENGLKLVSQSAPQAELILSFANAAASTEILAALCDSRAHNGFSKREVERRLAQNGYVNHSIESVVMPRESVPLSADTEAKLRQLFEQLNAQAAVERFVIHAKRGATPSRADTQKGVLSIVVCDSSDESALQGTLSSIARQMTKPMEVIVVSNRNTDDAVRALKGRNQVTVHQMLTTLTSKHLQWNAGLKECTGQYVSFLEAGVLLDVNYFSKLKLALQNSTRAWAVAHVEHSLPALLTSASVQSARCLFDVTALGQFSLSWADDEAAEQMLFARVFSLFEPIFVPACSVDFPFTPRTLDAVIGVLKERPLQELRPLLFRFSRASVEKVVLDSLKEKAPTLIPLAQRTLTLMKRVERAYVDARASAKKSTGKKSD